MQPMFILTRFGKYGVLGLCLKLLLVISFSPWDDLGGRRGRCCEGSSHRQSHTTGSSAQVPIATVAQRACPVSPARHAAPPADAQGGGIWFYWAASCRTLS